MAGIFFLTRFEFVFTFLDGTLLQPPQPSKSCPSLSDRKTHSGNYKSTCCQYIRSIYLINFKKRSLLPSNFGALALVACSQKKTPDMGSQYYTRSNESITMKQMFNCAYCVRVTVLYCFCSFGVVRVFFFLVSVATRKKASYFKWPSVQALRVRKVILFDVNKATYSQQNSHVHLNGCNRWRIIEDL